ncbi:MAG TPA: hypothetical protein VG916_13970 [Gemmatimonadaceae bacterium]|nr:hypothetical protein [Gemmatimonadaceae bacterium]
MNDERRQGVAPPLAMVTAVGMAALCMLPFLEGIRPYPPSILQFWAIGAVALLPLSAVAGAMPERMLLGLPSRMGRLALRPSPLAFAAIVGGVTTALALYFSLFVFERGPSTSDEIAQLWHAKIILHGHLSLPADPNPEFFAIDNVIDRGRWYSHFPIGGPLALVPGVLVGAPWLVNPVMAGLAVAAFFHFARVAYGELPGRAVGALLALTPNISIMAGTYLNHVPTLLCAACAFAALAEWDRAVAPRARAAWAAAVGAAIGCAATLRPLDAVVLMGVIGAYQLVVMVRTRRSVAELAAQVVGGTLAVAPLFYANWRTNGSPLRFGYDVMWGAGHRVGFHTDPHGVAHTPGRAIEYALRYVSETNYAVMAWPFPALAVAFTGLAAMRRVTRWDALVFAFLGAQLGAYAVYWGLGEFLGPRFLFTAFPALVVLLARTPFLMGEREGPRVGRAAAAFLVLCTVVAWTAPPVLDAVRGSAAQVRAARRAMRVDLQAAARAAHAHHALVFVREPFSARLLHRVWGVGVSRPEAVAAIETRDACSLLAAVADVENDSAHAIADPVAYLEGHAAPFVPGPQQVRTADPNVRITSAASVTPACRAEFDAYDWVPAFFGTALPLEPIGPDGHLDGDVIWAMDLGIRDEVLRRRFGDRTWYRVTLATGPDGRPVASLQPY